MGLINRIVPRHGLMPAARDLAGRILRHSPLAVAAVLPAVTRGLNTTTGDGLQIEREQFARVAPTHDVHEGLATWAARPILDAGPIRCDQTARGASFAPRYGIVSVSFAQVRSFTIRISCGQRIACRSRPAECRALCPPTRR
jgi:hypothetical protein